MKNTRNEKAFLERLGVIRSTYPHFFKALTIVLLVFILLVPLSIWVFYLFGRDHLLVPTDISAGEILSYWGTILSFIGTLCLGFLVLWQNEKLNLTNQKLLRFQLDEYAPYLSFISYKQSMPDPSRIPDTTQSVLYRGVGEPLTQEELDKFESDVSAIEKSLPQMPKTEEEWQRFRAGHIEIGEKFKQVQKPIVKKYYEVFWIIQSTSEFPGTAFSALEALGRLSHQFVFRNASKTKLKKIVLQSIKMIGMGDWVFTSHKDINYISSLIEPGEDINFNINLYWENTDTDLSLRIREFGPSFEFNFILVSIGGNEQQERINVGTMLGSAFDPTYELI